MAISTYAELKVAIQNWAKRSDILSVIDDFIDLTEADLWQRLRIREMETRSTASTTATRFYTLPTGYVEMRRLRVNDEIVEFETPFNLNILDGSGVPKNYTITSQVEFDRVPDGTYTIEYQFYASLTALSASNTTNAVLTRFPMLYLYGALFHFGQWAQDDVMVNKYSTLFAAAIDAANKADRAGRYGPGKAMKPVGSTP